MRITIKRVLVGVLALLGGLLALSDVLSLRALGIANRDLRTVYEDRVVPLRDLKIISDAYAVFIVDASHKVRTGNIPWETSLASVEKAKADIRARWDAYLATPLVDEERTLVEQAKPLMARADEAVERLTTAAIVHAGRVTAAGLARDFGIARPRLAVAALNPHAGEDGSMGREEIAIIAPAVAALRAAGIEATGPHPADTLFHAAARGGYDAALCMYHDQALIPLKTIDFDSGVNVTLGLPFVRTSPDHGTALDIAGTGRAGASSLIAALGMADAMARARRAAV